VSGSYLTPVPLEFPGKSGDSFLLIPFTVTPGEIHTPPVAGLALILSIGRFTSEAR
jgi:hypothetical protein